MNRFIIEFLVLVAGVVALGVYQGWFTFTSNNSDDKANVNIKVDKDKIHEDEQKAVKKVHDLGQKANDKAAGVGETIKGKTERPE